MFNNNTTGDQTTIKLAAQKHRHIGLATAGSAMQLRLGARLKARKHQYVYGLLPHRSNELFEYFNNQPSGHISLDLTGRILQINTAAAKILQIDISNARGRNLVSLLPAIVRDKYQHHLNNVLQSGRTVIDKLALTDNFTNNREFKLISKKLTLLDKQNEFILTTFAIDENNRNFEKELAVQQEFVNNLLQIAHFIVLVLDSEGNVVSVNRYFEELTGYTQEEIAGKNWMENFIPHTYVESIDHLFKKAIGGTRTIGNINPIIIKDGSQKVIEWYDTQIKDGEKVAGLVTIGLDITERIDAEEKAKDSQNQMKLIMNSLPLLIAHLDVNQCYVFANQSHDNWFPDAEKNYLGKHMHLVIGAEFYENLLPYLLKGLAGQQVAGEISVKIKGQTHIFVVNLLAIHNQSGDITGVYLVMDDVTKFKVTDANMIQHLAQLAHESRINLVGKMMSEIAHEVNQPLTAITNYCGAGLRLHQLNRLPSDELTQILENVLSQVQRATDIITHLKYFTKKREILFVITNMNELVQQVLKLMTIENSLDEIELNYVPERENINIYVDPVMIEQVIINLIRNSIEALKGMTDRKPSIMVSTKVSHETLTLLVSDNGPGLSMDMASQIFKPFYGTKSDNMGLGLSICQTIVDLHHGKLWVEQNADAGVTFSLQLPIHQDWQHIAS